MDSQRFPAIARWILAFSALAGIVLGFRQWFHVNPTTVALTLLLYILLLASRWGLRYAVAVSLVATVCYNVFFLPPIGTLVISDPQNWLALFAFLVTSVVSSRLSQKARDEAQEARTREREVEMLFSLSRDLLQTEKVATLLKALPELIHNASHADSVTLYLLDGDRLYRTGSQDSSVDVGHFRKLALTLASPETTPDKETCIPLRAGVRPRGLLLVSGLELSSESFQAIGGLVSIALDRAQAMEEVARSQAGKESERLRTLILDSITHELRTPLTSIKGAASTLLSTEGISEEDQRELLKIVDEESDRLNRLVGQALQMAQIEAREVHMNFAPIAIEDLIEETREICAPVLNSHPITINIPALPKVKADAEMVAKVLCNLLENAAKYSRSRSPIFVSAEQRDGYVLTSVADRGNGIDPAEQDLIFDRLYRSHSYSGTVSGTGMGLPISRAIVEAHGGHLTVTSEPDHGSVFTFSLPVANAT